MMKKIMQFGCLLILALAFTRVKGQDVTGKDIAGQAAKAVLDTENIATASAAGISGTFTAAKMPVGQKEDLRKGFYAGVLELKVKGDYGKFKSGRFNLFFKEGGQGLRLYLEENGAIGGVFEVTQTTPEDYKETTIGDKPGLEFPQPPAEGSQSRNFASITGQTVNSFTSYAGLRRCKIYIKIIYKHRAYWVWGGSYKQCGGSTR